MGRYLLNQPEMNKRLSENNHVIKQILDKWTRNEITFNYNKFIKKTYKAIAMRIPCKGCAICCRSTNFVMGLKELDVKRLMTKLKLTEKELVEKYNLTKAGQPIQGGQLSEQAKKIMESSDGSKYNIMLNPCPFLKDNICSVYKMRPTHCRGFPIKLNRGIDLDLAFYNARFCPIMYNTMRVFARKMLNTNIL